jgi:hypothetical protein
MMNKSLLAHSAKSSRKSIYGFQQVRLLKRRCAKGTLQKKSRRFRRLLKLITGRRQTEWTGATRCPNRDDLSHKRESLINRKGAIFFRLCLPCRPLAECRPGVVGRAVSDAFSTHRPGQALVRAGILMPPAPLMMDGVRHFADTRRHGVGAPARWPGRRRVGSMTDILTIEKAVGHSFRHAAAGHRHLARFNSATGACAEKTFLTCQ